MMEERTILQKFFDIFSKNMHMISYGVDGTRKALEMAAVDDFIVIYELVSEEVLDELTDLAEDSRARIHLVTDKTPEGVQFKGLGGIGAILRYPIGN